VSNEQDHEIWTSEKDVLKRCLKTKSDSADILSKVVPLLGTED